MRLQDAAGLAIAADRAIPGLRPLDGGTAMWSIAFDRAPAWFAGTSSFLLLNRNTARVRGDGVRTVFEYPDETLFCIDEATREIWCRWATTYEDACTYLVGPVLSFALRRAGELVLHASAVALPEGGGAIAFIGPHASGKSTTAACFGRAGSTLLTDDLLRLTCDRHRWLAHPYGIGLRLWPSSSSLVFGRELHLPRIVPSWEKRLLATGMHGIEAAHEAVPLAAVFLLERRDGPLCIERLTPAAALLAVTANTSSNSLLTTAGRAREFTQLGHLVERVPCARLTIPAESLHRAPGAVAEWLARGCHAS